MALLVIDKAAHVEQAEQVHVSRVTVEAGTVVEVAELVVGSLEGFAQVGQVGLVEVECRGDAVVGVGTVDWGAD